MPILSEQSAITAPEDTDIIGVSTPGEDTFKFTWANLKARLKTAFIHGGSNEVATATPGANVIPKAGSDGKLAVEFIPALPTSILTSGTMADARIAASSVTQHQAALSVGYGQLTSVPSTFAPSAHATSHKSGGSDPIKLNEFAAPDGDVSLASHRLTNVTDPASAQDAATKAYVDSVAQGLDTKASVKAATTANLTLSGAQTVDGIALIALDRCLVKNQSAPAENGIYVVASGAWSRATDMDAWAEVPSAFVFVEGGSVNGDTGWTCTAAAGGTLDSTSVPWVQFSSAGVPSAGTGITQTGLVFAADFGTTSGKVMEGNAISGASAKTTPVDADTLPLTDSEAGSALKKVTLTNFKAFLKTYTDTLYTTAAAAIAAVKAGYVLDENASIGLDPAGSADGKYTGITITGTAGYTQAFGDLVYKDPTDSRWEAVDVNAAAGADGDARGTLAMVVSAGTDGTACTLLLYGAIRADAKFPALTINGPVYASETAGEVTQTRPATTDAVIRVVGFALTADEILFQPSSDYVTPE